VFGIGAVSKSGKPLDALVEEIRLATVRGWEKHDLAPGVAARIERDCHDAVSVLSGHNRIGMSDKRFARITAELDKVVAAVHPPKGVAPMPYDKQIIELRKHSQLAATLHGQALIHYEVPFGLAVTAAAFAGARWWQVHTGNG
jgi:hypothetical protein